MEYDWYKESEPHTAPIYAARAILPYLMVGNVRGATTSYRAFTSALTTSNPGLSVQDLSSGDTDVRVFPSLPLLNFLGLLLLAVQRGAPDAFKGLVSKYAAQINETDMWGEALESIAEMYFGIVKPRQSNPLMDMMSGFFGGGGAGGAGGQQPQRPARMGIRSPEAPPAAGLD